MLHGINAIQNSTKHFEQINHVTNIRLIGNGRMNSCILFVAEKKVSKAKQFIISDLTLADMI